MTGLTHENEMFPKIKEEGEGGKREEEVNVPKQAGTQGKPVD